MTWRPIDRDPPNQHKLVLVRGDSGYRVQPTFYISAYWEWRQPLDPAQRGWRCWKDSTGEELRTMGLFPEEWMELPR